MRGEETREVRVLQRPQVRGKFLFEGHEKIWIRGVTYGTLRPGIGDAQFPSASVAARDFAAMAASGLNTVRVYTVPPKWLLDLAASNGLRVMIGVPWEQHIAFLLQDVRCAVRECLRHPAVLCYAVGNEIPAPVVRW